MAATDIQDTKGKSRLDWVDTDKGLSIILVVARHTASGVALSLGKMPLVFGLISTLAAPYRMPLFFVVAGLFAASYMQRPLREFIDKKLLHFAYFYFLWSAIQIGMKMSLPGGLHEVGIKDLLLSPIEPFGVLWFIYALPLFFVMMRLMRNVPKLLVVAVALIFYFARIDTGWTVPDEAALRFIFFVGGVYCAPYVFQIADWAHENALNAVLLGLVTLVSIGVVTLTPLIDMRAVELLAGIAGCIGCVMLVSVATSKGLTGWLTYIGSRSLYVFVAFFLPMALTRVVMVKAGVTNGDLITLVAVSLGVALPLVAARFLEGTHFAFFFTRPQFLRLDLKKKAPAAQAVLPVVKPVEAPEAVFDGVSLPFLAEARRRRGAAAALS
ncbi:MAG TPA: acyltransferase family protein [Parvibaculum sp.]|jgi:uncharacterized membrane protein YcfT